MTEDSQKLSRRTGQLILDILEKYIPAVTFSVMFSVFVLQIFFRYMLNRPLTWPYEITIFAFIWTAVLGACYAQRHQVHVVFSLVYDRLNPRGRLFCRIAGNLLIFTSFCIAFYPTYAFVQFMKIDKSTVLKIPFNIAFFPYIVFLLLIIGRVGYDLFVDLKKLFKEGSIT